MQKRPKPPSKYYKIMSRGPKRYPLESCPFCDSNAPFVFERGVFFQDGRAKAAYRKFLTDDNMWRYLAYVSALCGIAEDEFEHLHGPRPDSETYLIGDIPLSHHWSRFREGVCNECGTKIWHDLVQPFHYYYRPPDTSSLQLPLISPTGAAPPGKEAGCTNLDDTDEDLTAFGDLFRTKS